MTRDSYSIVMAWTAQSGIYLWLFREVFGLCNLLLAEYFPFLLCEEDMTWAVLRASSPHGPRADSPKLIFVCSGLFWSGILWFVRGAKIVEERLVCDYSPNTIPIMRNSEYQDIYFLAFDFCRFCVVIWFFQPRHNGQWPPTSQDFLSQILSITFIFLS